MKTCSLGKVLQFGIFIFLIHTSVYAQDFQLAEEYFVQGKYDKAKDIYDKLARHSYNWRSIHQNYLLTLINLKDYKTAEEFLRKQIKQEPENLFYKVDFAVILEMQGKTKEAEKEYLNLIEAGKKDRERAKNAYEALEKYDKYEWAEKLFLEARKYDNSNDKYALQLTEVYAKLGKKPELLQESIKLYNKGEDYGEYVKGTLQDEFRTDEELNYVEETLLAKVQEEPNHRAANELLLWLYMQQKNFIKAFVQAKAIDKRFKKQGSQLFEIGRIAFENKDYPATEKILGYFVEQYPNDNLYFIPARRYLIKAREEVIKNTFPIDKEKVKMVIQDYQDLINTQGKSKTVEALKDMAHLYAFYLDDKEKAIEILQDAITEAHYNSKLVAQCKIVLGDIYVLKGEFGEAALYYYQAEREQKDSPIGHEAKLKNAKLSYYKGEFETAQNHLDILKNATSREIANDAIDMSVFIQDNTGLDSTETAMREFARIDLLIFQNKLDQALNDLEQMLKKFPNHSLTDDIYWAKANIFIRMGKASKAVEMYELILKNYAFDILADDAHFALAKTYEEILQNKEKAKELYQEHLTKFPGSRYVAEARKRFRILRGDKLK
ncbi:MAG: tetratricopeptide repeat protein [Raineya sp.]|nr:tetratricopeptide repeat protein [Raineya sp.]